MGRAIGLFLLAVGIGLAAYGLPSTEPDRIGRSSGGGGRSAGESSIERTPEASVDDRSRAVEERSRANGALTRMRNTAPSPLAAAPVVSAPASTRSVAGQSAQVQPAPAVAPMEKLRAAANARAQAAADEPAGILRPLSASTDAEVRSAIPRPVEITAGLRPAIPAPAVIATARRETSASAGQGSTARIAVGPSKITPVWTTSGATSAAALATPAPTRTATITIPSTPRSEMSMVKKPAVITTSIPDNAADEQLANASAAGDRSELAEKPAAKPPRTQLAQRHTPPVYLGRPVPPSYVFVPSYSSGFPSAIVNSAPRRNFRTQDMWDRQRRDGM